MGRIITSSGEQISFSISENKNWLFARSQNLYQIKSTEDCYHILPLVELERDKVISLLKGEIGNIKPNISPTELYSMLLKFSIRSNTHWGVMAIPKLKNKDLDEELIELIERILNEKMYNQKSRHTLAKIKSNR